MNVKLSLNARKQLGSHRTDQHDHTLPRPPPRRFEKPQKSRGAIDRYGQRPLGLSGTAGDVALLEAARADVSLHAASILVHGDALDVRFERAVDGAMRVTY